MKIDVLDHGYVESIEWWGQGKSGEREAAIIEAARQSTQGSFRGWEADQKLLEFMFKNNHSTPFEFCGMTIEIQAPIFVFREWHRHRTQSYNEMSARYAPLPDINYMPTIERCFATQEKNKQAQPIDGAVALSENVAENWLRTVNDFYGTAESLYQAGLANGIPKEIARIVLPVGRYSRMRATANLRNWLGFLTLRLNPNAQYEIRMYAEAVGQVIGHLFPRTWELFESSK